MNNKEKCFRELNDTLFKTISQSILKQFASNLGVKIDQGKQPKQDKKKQVFEEQIEDTEDFIGDSRDESKIEDADEEKADKLATIEQFEKLVRKGDQKGLTKMIKSLTVETVEDINLKIRQKKGQLRFGDVITINFQKEIFDKTQGKVHTVNSKFKQNKKWAQKNLFDPDYVYHGLLYSDGVTDSGIKMIPKVSVQSQNACNMFKQCLFRIEVLQSCEVNKRRMNLVSQKNEEEQKLKRLIKDKGGENNVKPEMILQIKKDIEKIDDEIIDNESQKLTEEDNNRYQQEYNRGKKLTYGTSFQLYHLFSGKYLTLNLNEMSSEHGSCELELHQTTDQSQWVIEPSEKGPDTAGYVVNYEDYFNINTLNTSSQFSIHVYEKDQYKSINMQKQFYLSASNIASPLKAKLFMGFNNAEKEKSGIQSGDVIRLRSFDVDSYLTTQIINVDSLLPCLPDFLKNQIRRMHDLQQIEQQPGGKELSALNPQEKKYRDQDSSFKLAMVDDEYVKEMKSKSKESIYIEQNQQRLKFTNSCWEIQRVNPLMGANLILQEIVRFRHVGTGKFLCVDDNEIDLILTGSSNDLDTLFSLKSDMSNKTPTKYLHQDGNGIIDNPKYILGNNRVLVQSWKTEKYLQISSDSKFKPDQDVAEEVSESDISQEDLNVKTEDAGDSQLRVAAGDFQKQEKNRMIFYIEEVDSQDSIYSYQCACMFDELLEFYCFLNQFGVAEFQQDDHQEKYQINLQTVKKYQSVLSRKVGKMLFILQNIDLRIQQSTEKQRTDEMLNKCKDELSDQGLLDILFCIIEMLYYKTTPPSLFEKIFKNNSQEQKEQEKLDRKAFKVADNESQQIIRDETSPLLKRILEIIFKLVNDHQNNCEKISKYFGILFQQYRAQESYKMLTKMFPSFKVKYHPSEIMSKLGDIFIITQKICTFVIPDRNLQVLIDHKETVRKMK